MPENSDANPRNIVIFCDGTWNSPSEEAFGLPTPTNVFKLYRACLDAVQSHGRQITWYQPGVGATGGVVRRVFEGATGVGIGANIRRGYAAIAAHYRGPQDRIFLIGFSRGAFTARSIAGMIQKVGLLKQPTRMAIARAYKVYQTSKNEASPRARAHRAGADVHQDVRIHAIGVWDTVGALGFSLWGWSFNLRAIWSNAFHRLSPNLITEHAFQALAFDEKRTSFVPVLWHDIGDQGGVPTGIETGRRPIVEEAWFRGVHSDVGGGYGDSRLSDIALQWLIERLGPCGLELRPGAPKLNADHNGLIHNSTQGPLWTSVASWPRWPATKTLDEGASPRSYLHGSVAARESDLPASNIDERGRRRLSIGEAMEIEIRARYQWDYAGVALEAGGKYQLSAQGSWEDRQGTPVGPEGHAADESWGKRLTRWARRKRNARWMALIALPNIDFGWKWRELGVADAIRYLVIEDPAEFARHLMLVGENARRQIEPTTDAFLWCFANGQWKSNESNAGSVVLTIERVG